MLIHRSQISHLWRLFPGRCSAPGRFEKSQNFTFQAKQYVIFLLNSQHFKWVKASVLRSVDLGFISHVESYQKTLKNGIHSFPAWRSTCKECCGEQVGKFACCVLGQGTQRDVTTFMRKTGGPDNSEMATPKRVRTSRPKNSDQFAFK